MASSSLSLSALSLFIILLLSLLISPSQSQTCSSQSFTNKTLYTHCNDLPSLNSFLHYTYNPAQSTLSLVFIAPPAKPDGWIAWSINPMATGMIGAQTLVAFKSATGEMAVKTYNITAYAPLKESKVWFKVKDSKAESSGGVIRLFATLVLPEEHKTTLNHVWQVGAAVDNGVPAKHEFQPANLNAKGTLDLLKGESSGATGVDSKTKKKNIHGILNGLSWGILFPLGIIIARYLRTFPSADPAWFYLHVTCQVSAYILGVAGWGTGLKLGSLSKGVTYTYHRGIGIALFCLATIQISALLLRPNKEHKYRIYWNIYHHGIGYSIVILGIINVFKGLDILMPAKKWKSGYIIVLAILGGVALLLEVITWIIVLKRRARKSSTKPYDGFNNGD